MSLKQGGKENRSVFKDLIQENFPEMKKKNVQKTHYNTEKNLYEIFNTKK